MSSRQSFNIEDESSYKDERFDDQIFELFFKNHFVQLCAFCQFKFGFDLDLSKDIVQTAFIRLWETRQNISGEPAVKSYLLRIIHNYIIDIIKHDKVKQRYRKFFFQNNSASSYSTEIDDINFKQLSADIQHSVSRLPDQMRIIFELSRYEGLKYKDIAERLDISVKTVETQISRALAKLRLELGHYLTISIALGLLTAALKKYFLLL